MNGAKRVMVERFDAEIKLYEDMICELGRERCKTLVWKAEDLQDIFEKFQLKLKSCKELILWSEEKEI